MSHEQGWIKVGDSDFKEIIYEKKEFGNKGLAARITINRPEKRNAVTELTIKEIMLALDDASNDPETGVVVLTGAGDKAFCAGGDLNWEASGRSYRLYFETADQIQHYLRLCRKPIIAAVKGYAIGWGNHVAYFCDFTIAADNAIFGQNGPRVGSPAHGYVVAYLTRVVGAKKAREMWMLCRRYNAQESLQMGLVNAVVPLAELDAEVDRWCDEILSLSPTCIEILKASFDADIDYMRGNWGTFLNFMAPYHLESDEAHEAQQAFFEKRPPEFRKFRLAKKRSMNQV